MPRLRFKHHFHVEAVPPDKVFLLSERRYHILSGRLYYLLSAFLNGEYDVQGIIKALEGKVSPAQIQYTLNRLKTAGYVIETEGMIPPQQSAFWDMLSARPGLDRPHRIALHSCGLDTGRTEVAFFQSMGMETTNQAPDLDVILTDDYLNPRLQAFNLNALQKGTPWLVVKPVGAVLWVGPVFQPGEGACWECLAQRLRSNRPLESFLEHTNNLPSPIGLSKAALPSTLHTALAFAATEITRWINTQRSELVNHVLTFDALTLQTQHHTLVKRPQCPVCSNQKVANRTPLVLESRQKITESDGGHRSMAAAETFERYRHHISPITGAVSLLERVPNTGPFHVYAAGPNKSRPFDHWQSLRRSLRSNNAGKGIDDIQAKVSGLAEALERYSGIYQGDEPSCKASYVQLQHEAVHPAECLLFSEIQYREREQWNTHCPPHLEVPEPFDEERVITWTPVWSFTEGRFKYLPMAYCYYDSPDSEDMYFCTPDSNGNAAGSSLEDAVLQGFLELVERDSISIWWDNRVLRPGVNLESLDNPYVNQVRAYHASLNREVWVLDLTTDLNIPVFVALSRRIDRPHQDIIMGFGAHLDAKVAALRAITELNQMLPAVLDNDPNRQGDYNSESPWEIQWWQNATIDSEPYLGPHPKLPTRQIQDYATLAHRDDLCEDVLTCIEIARNQGMEVLVLDQTRPDIKLTVVKVIVPGMRHFWRRYAPGRLYDVPVQLGWLDQPRLESELNPWPMSL